MPGRTPAKAVEAFLEPLHDALRLLDGVANLSTSPKGGFRKGVRYSWQYKLRDRDGRDQWRIHWHPEGRSRVTVPHLHRPPDLKQHWPTGRMTLENAVGWCIETGASVTCATAEQAQNNLAVIEAPHRLYRSWT